MLLSTFLVLTGTIIAWIGGYIFGKMRRETYNTDMNNFLKAAARSGSVPEMIAPGENAEVVELDGSFKAWTKCPNKCFGCIYAGRYLLPGYKTASTL